MVIMALPIETLFQFSPIFEGFQAHSQFDYEGHIIHNQRYGRRGNLEVDPSHKQPIPYVLIVNPKTKMIYAYQRSSQQEHAHESRLHGKWSWGVGGHVEQIDGEHENPIRVCLEREVVREEVNIKGDISGISILGYINESDEVGKVHFGLLYVLETSADEVVPSDLEMKSGSMVSFSELERILASPEWEVEGWSRIALGPLREYLASLS